MEVGENFALSSQSEGLSIALLEALCFGLPIITTNLTSAHDVITDGVHGFVVPPNNEKLLAQALASIYTNPTFKENCRHINVNLVKNHYDLAATAAQYRAVFCAAHQKQTCSSKIL